MRRFVGPPERIRRGFFARSTIIKTMMMTEFVSILSLHPKPITRSVKPSVIKTLNAAFVRSQEKLPPRCDDP